MDHTTWQPESGWTPEECVFEARAVRDTLAVLGVMVPHCLPGEPEDCGTPAWAHYGTYLAMLKAKAQLMIEANLSAPGPGQDKHFGEHVYNEVLDGYRRELFDDGTGE